MTALSAVSSTRMRRVRKNIWSTFRVRTVVDFELTQTVKMKTRNSIEGYFGN